jgi:hypothetical protein
MDYDEVAAEFLRALRGKRSQTGFCRRLGYKSNVAYTWESKRGFPTATRTFEIAQRLGIEPDEALTRFFRVAPPWLGQVNVTTASGISALLTDLRGSTSIVELASVMNKSRFAVSRWIKGETDPKLPEFFQLVECSSLRLIDFIETFVDPREMPSIKNRWQTLQTARDLAYETPWTQGVLRVLELDEYRKLQSCPPGWIAAQIGISPEEELHCLTRLAQVGQIREVNGKWETTDIIALDTRKDPSAAAQLRTWWGRVALERVERGQRGMMYNLFSVSQKDLARLRELQKAYFTELRSIVAQSEPVERVVLATVQLLDLGEDEASVPRPDPPTGLVL